MNPYPKQFDSAKNHYIEVIVKIQSTIIKLIEKIFEKDIDLLLNKYCQRNNRLGPTCSKYFSRTNI